MVADGLGRKKHLYQKQPRNSLIASYSCRSEVFTLRNMEEEVFNVVKPNFIWGE